MATWARLYVALVFAIFPVLSGCSLPTEEGFRQRVSAWKGRSADDLVRKIGPPMASYQLSTGEKVLQYSSARTIDMGGIPVPAHSTTYSSGVVGTQLYSGTSSTSGTQYTPAVPVTFSCTVRYVVGTDNLIEDVSWTGNNCRANAP